MRKQLAMESMTQFVALNAIDIQSALLCVENVVLKPSHKHEPGISRSRLMTNKSQLFSFPDNP